jgi:hypothetical protein
LEQLGNNQYKFYEFRRQKEQRSRVAPNRTTGNVVLARNLDGTCMELAPKTCPVLFQATYVKKNPPIDKKDPFPSKNCQLIVTQNLPTSSHSHATQKQHTTTQPTPQNVEFCLSRRRLFRLFCRCHRRRQLRRISAVGRGGEGSVVPPRRSGGHRPRSAGGSGALAGDATAGSDNDDDDDYEGEDEEEEDG